MTNSINSHYYGNEAPRGRILDINGKVLVDNKLIKSLVFHDNKYQDSYYIKLTKDLAKIISIDNPVNINIKRKYYYLNHKNEINSRIDNNIKTKYLNRLISKAEYTNYIYSLITNQELNTISNNEVNIFYLLTNGYSYQDKIIKEYLTSKEMTLINELNNKDIEIVHTYKRTYNYSTDLNELFGDIGYIPKEQAKEYINNGYQLNDIVGISYLEKHYDEILRGKKAEYLISDNKKILLANEKKGSDLVLNIDIDIQLKIEELLKQEMKNIKKYPSSKYYNGSYIIISNPNNGQIKAIAAKKYENNKIVSNITGVIKDSITPGSIVKMASFNVLYNNNVINNKTKITDSCIKLANQNEKCSWKSLGVLDNKKALGLSSNYFQFIGAINVANQKYKRNMVFKVTNEDFDKYRSVFNQYGLGTKTYIDIDGEESGIEGKSISGDLLLNLSIGQYDTYTPIMINQYINSVSNGLYRYQPQIVNSYISNNNKTYIQSNIINNLPITQENMAEIHDGLHYAVTNGTAKSYFKDGLGSGKTGTAETNYNGINTLSKNFVGYYPNKNPLYTYTIISPNIYIQNNTNNYKYPLNSHLSREISNILFEK